MKLGIITIADRRYGSGTLRSALLAVGVISSLVLVRPAVAQGQNPIVYPSRGQSMQQQAADEGECRGWAQQQTGFNPTNVAQYQSSTSAGQGSAVRGAARGAALGAVGGAIGGDAGKGAAIGAGVGAAAGLMGRRRQQVQVDQQNQQAQQNYNAGMTEYNRAFAGCMGGRGYTVN